LLRSPRWLSLVLPPCSLRALEPRPTSGSQCRHGPDPQGAPITVGIWYPADATPKPRRWASDGQVVATGAPLVGEHLPLIVMSHGNGGFFGGHADTAQALAEAGFVVAALTHTGDNYEDQSRATDMANRPRQMSTS
jgi:predicted dienelactone hydrolase